MPTRATQKIWLIPHTSIKVRQILCVLSLSLLVWSCSESPSDLPSPDFDGTYVSGSLASDSVWSRDDSPFVITTNVVIPRENTLTIEPGTEIRFNGAYQLVVQGELSAVGTAAQPIRFTSNQPFPEPSDWRGIAFENTVDANVLEYARLEYADVAVLCSTSEVQITDCWITNNRIGVRLVLSPVTLTHSVIQDNVTGIDANRYETRSRPAHITNNIITQNENGIVVSALPGGFNINSNNMTGNFVYGILVETRCLISVVDGTQNCPAIKASENWWDSTDKELIANQIFDHEDFSDLIPVGYIPYATSEISKAGPRL